MGDNGPHWLTLTYIVNPAYMVNTAYNVHIVGPAYNEHMVNPAYIENNPEGAPSHDLNTHPPDY